MAYIDNVTNILQIQPDGLPTFVRLSQNENGRNLYFQLAGNEIDIPANATITISGTKPDGTVYSGTGSISDNVILIPEMIQMTAVAGYWDAKVKIISGGNTIATGRIRFVIDADTVDPDSVPSDSELEGLVAEAQQYAETARTEAYGSPLTATTAAGMTDHTRVYVYTGSESGYTAGHWYFWNGSAWTDGGIYNSTAVNTDTTLTLAGVAADAKATGDAIEAARVAIDDTLTNEGEAADAAAVGSEISGLKEDLNILSDVMDDISEDYDSEEEIVEVNVPLDLSDIRTNTITSSTVGNEMNISNSQVTTAIIRAFVCEADKTYKLTVTNGATPAAIGSRPTVVISTQETSGATCLEVFQTTNTANAQDIVEFTPSVSGYVYFNLDLNYQSVAVTTTETHTVTEKTAVDKVVREDVKALSELPTIVGKLSNDVSDLSDSVDATTELVDLGFINRPITLDLSYERVDKRSNGVIDQTVSLDHEHNTGFNNSSVTNCIARCFECEANKTYTLTVTNGATPAAIGERDTVVVCTPIEGAYTGIIKYILRTRNTSNVKDTVEFTPTVSGYVFFNVDKNYQSIEVTAKEQNIVLSAIDKVARTETDLVTKLIIGNEKEEDITFEQGTFDASLADTTGTGYRSNVISGIGGCAVCIKVDPSYAFTYGDGVNALKTIYGIYVIHPSTDTIRIGLSDTPENVGFEMRIYTDRGHKGSYDVIVAASDSEDADKLKADIVCDGTNDELDIQFAVNWNFDRRRRVRYNDHCRVLLMPGTYNIDSFTQQYTAYGQLTRERYAVMFGNDNYDHYAYYTYRISIEGCYETEHGQSNCATLIKVTDNGISSLGNDTLNSIFGMVLLADGTTGAIRSNNISMIVRNLGFYINGITNKIITIDAYQAGNVVIENCDMWTCINGYQPPETVATAPEGSIGIRAGRGSCMGVRQSIKGNRIQGFHDGISLCGEHFIVQDNLEVACVYGFSTNQYNVGGAVQHPNIFIGNSVEQCLHVGRLGESGMRDTFIYIGGSVENMLTAGETRVAMLPIEISATTANRGRIESDSLASPYNESMFYEGYGQTFEQTIYPYVQA